MDSADILAVSLSTNRIGTINVFCPVCTFQISKLQTSNIKNRLSGIWHVPVTGSFQFCYAIFPAQGIIPVPPFHPLRIKRKISFFPFLRISFSDPIPHKFHLPKKIFIIHCFPNCSIYICPYHTGKGRISLFFCFPLRIMFSFLLFLRINQLWQSHLLAQLVCNWLDLLFPVIFFITIFVTVCA